MSKNYDNWERLVTAVLRRENDRQIALTNSRESSSIDSSSSSFSSISLIDHSTLSHSDLTVDHNGWKAMLPPNKQEVVWRSACMSFFLDQMTGKNCFLLGATKVMHGSCWGVKSHSKSRFSQVAELVESRELYILGIIETRMLTPDTLYAAYLVFGLADKHTKLESATSTIILFHDDDGFSEMQERILHFQSKSSGISRVDGWMEEEMGDFYVGEGENIQIGARLLETSGYNMRGLIVEGIEFRPAAKISRDGKRNRGGKGVFSNFRISG